jgi:uncharacterized protein YbcC (UPF0753/DUF2309 family)
MTNEYFNLQHSLHKLAHYLPSQAPLKDFIHHNTLHAFQHLKFHEGLQLSSNIFGFKTYLNLSDYREFYSEKQISEAVLDKILADKKGNESAIWKKKLLKDDFDEAITARIGCLRNLWKTHFRVNPDKEVHTILFKVIGAFLDQGVSIWIMPSAELSFWEALREMETKSFSSFFSSSAAKKMMRENNCSIESLLYEIVGDERLYERYLFDQQFAHSGWSGMVAVLENQGESLLDSRKISLEDFIKFELLLEYDFLYSKFDGIIPKISTAASNMSGYLFEKKAYSELFECYSLWQEVLEWSYYDQVLKGIKQADTLTTTHNGRSFQAMLCIDDRECSFRRYIEKLDAECKTFGTPGFFNIDSFFQPEHSKFSTKICPAPVSPKHIIKEEANTNKRKKDAHFSHRSHSLLGGWLISLTLGFWSIVQLALSIFRPKQNAMIVSSFNHMSKDSRLIIEHNGETLRGYQLGYTVDEMTNRLEALLRSIGLVENFAPIIYAIGHGASSVNNTHYAGYDCGACSGRPGSVNARTIAFIGNHPKVREKLATRGIFIPDQTRFIGGLHETTRDEIEFYDEPELNQNLVEMHKKNSAVFAKALSFNAKERSRRFILTDSHSTPEKVHKIVKLRAVSLFEPRPELNHATNALCIVGRRELTDHLFLDRRAFMNSYDYRVDPEGKYLLNILRAATPVVGGINLEYYFSRVDPYRLGAGTKLPHNVMGLIGVANGMEGDLRTGLPYQMVEVHDPVRLMMIVEQDPEIVLRVIKSSEPTYEWFINEWQHLVVVCPETHVFYQFKDGNFNEYTPISKQLESKSDFNEEIETTESNFPIYIIND